MATTQTRSAPASGLPYFVWEVPEKPISIQFFFDALDRMYPEIMRGLGALKRRGAEVGGILLGRSDSPGKVIVEDFESVPTEYLTGPSYNLSENDLVSFEAALESRRSGAASGLSVVGFYRSHTRDGLFMDDADMALAKRYFPDAGNVFLIVKPFASRTSIGGFFFWEDGEINRESCYLQFPFHRGELGGGEPRPIPAAAPPESERPLPPYTPAAELRRKPAVFDPEEEPFTPAVRSSLSILAAPPPETPLRTSRAPGARWLLVACLPLVATVAFFAYRELAAPKPPATLIDLTAPETTLPLKLSVSEKQNQLDVTWDRNAPAIVQAKRGVLSISDGSNKKDLELTGPQLRTGRVLYSRLSADVGLRLEVFGEGSTPVTETIRIVSTEQPPRIPEPSRRAAQADVAERLRKTPPPEKARPAARRAPKRAAESAPKQDAAPPSPPPEVELQRPARR